jgi:hypothetical protein
VKDYKVLTARAQAGLFVVVDADWAHGGVHAMNGSYITYIYIYIYIYIYKIVFRFKILLLFV